MKTKLLFAFLASTNLALANTTESLSPSQVQARTNNNSISSNFLKAKLKHEGVQNTMVSSVSLYYAMAVLSNGAEQETKRLVENFLVKPETDINAISVELAKTITASQSEEFPESGVFQLSNSVWATNGATNGQPFVLNEDFIAAAKANYDAEVQSLDFKEAGASEVLNTWAKEKTNGLIPSIIDDATLQRLEWAIMNAAYFEGTWGTSVYRRFVDNSDYEFNKLNGEKTKVDSIYAPELRASVIDGDDGSTAFALPFAGAKYKMVVLLPSSDEKDLNNWLVETGVTSLEKSVEALESAPKSLIAATLPVFSFDDGVKIESGKPLAVDLGLQPLFEDDANFSSLVDAAKTSALNAQTKVGLIKQNTRIELDEKGVKAAAVTLIGGVRTTSIRIERPRQITVDRPFLFAIVESKSGTILFNGVVTDPQTK